MQAEFRFNSRGWFQIIVDGHESEWSSYDSIATLKVGDDTYLGISQYFDGNLPAEQVIKLSRDKVETTATTKQLCNICGRVEVTPVSDKTWMPASYKVQGKDIHHYLTNRVYWSCPDHQGQVEQDGNPTTKLLDEKPERYIDEESYMEETEEDIERRR